MRKEKKKRTQPAIAPVVVNMILAFRFITKILLNNTYIDDKHYITL